MIVAYVSLLAIPGFLGTIWAGAWKTVKQSTRRSKALPAAEIEELKSWRGHYEIAKDKDVRAWIAEDPKLFTSEAA